MAEWVRVACRSSRPFVAHWFSVCAGWEGEERGAVLTSLSRVIFHGAIRNAVRVRPCCRPRPT